MILKANALRIPLCDRSVQTVVTSPPYWGLRDYGLPPTVWGGDLMCDHSFGAEITRRPQSGSLNGSTLQGTAPGSERRSGSRSRLCECGAWLGNLGLEPTPDLYVEHMVGIFREIWRVLRDDGTLWLNLGDCYASGGGSGLQGITGQRSDRRHSQPFLGVNRGKREGDPKAPRANLSHLQPNRYPQVGLKPKDLVGMPWKVAFALQADGWYLRSDIIWSKPNPQPESVKDRPTQAHEYLFLLAKSERYFYDAKAIQEAVTGNAHARGDGVNPKAKKVPAGWDTSTDQGGHGRIHRDGRLDKQSQGGRRNAGFNDRWKVKQNESFSGSINELVDVRNKRSVWTVGTQPFPEAHFATFPTALIEPCILAGSRPGDIVFDPFFGSGTTAIVAIKHHRKWIGLELSDEYIGIARKRIARGVQQVLA